LSVANDPDRFVPAATVLAAIFTLLLILFGNW